MRRYRGRDGGICLWYDDQEIEEIMAVELQRASLFPTPESAAVNIEHFVESHLKVRFEQYADLEPEVLGVTEFVPEGRPWIRINHDLTGSALDDDECPLGSVGRWRATVAHEAAHVILHSVLFAGRKGQLSFFDLESDPEPEIPRVFRSLKRDVSFSGGSTDWREVQANKGMAALLMPRTVFLAVCARESEKMTFTARAQRRDDVSVRMLASRLAELFQVSGAAAFIRLNSLGILAQLSQTWLIKPDF